MSEIERQAAGWTREHRCEFAKHGLTVLRCAVAAVAVAQMSARIWRLLAGRGVRTDRPDSWEPVRASLFGPLAARGCFDALLAPPVCAALDDILGASRWRPPPKPGQVLMHFPNAERWDVPSKVWHLDHRAPGAALELPGVQVFLIVDRVEPRGGGTLVIEGSHRCIDRIRQREGPGFAGSSSELRSALRREVPWLRELWSVRAGEDRIARFLGARHEPEGVGLRVVELTGEPGDVFVMHPWLVHAPSLNASRRPRVMVTERFRRLE